VLNGRVSSCQIDWLFVVMALLKSFQDQHALRATAGEIEVAGANGLPDLVIGRPVPPFTRQQVTYGLIWRQLWVELPDSICKQPVELIGGNTHELAPHQKRFDKREATP
jgi:hypothetical protein